MLDSPLARCFFVCLVIGLSVYLLLDVWVAKLVHCISGWFRQKFGWDKIMLAKYLAGALMSVWICIAMVAALSDLRMLGQSVCVAGLPGIFLGTFFVFGKKARDNSWFAKIILVTCKLLLWIVLIAIGCIGLVEAQPVQWTAVMVSGVMTLMTVLYIVTPPNKKCTDELPCRYPGLSA